MSRGGKKFTHELVIEVKFDEPYGQRQAQDKVHRWLEIYGFTATGHGFEFRTIGVITGKRVCYDRT